MPRFRVSVDMVRCCDVYVDAIDAKEAKRKVTDTRLWREQNDDAWCDGHDDTTQIGECVEAGEEE